jgi:hypothetical protein
VCGFIFGDYDELEHGYYSTPVDMKQIYTAIQQNAILALFALILRIATSTECQLTISYYGNIRRLLVLQLYSPSAQNPPIEFKGACNYS